MKDLKAKLFESQTEFPETVAAIKDAIRDDSSRIIRLTLALLDDCSKQWMEDYPDIEALQEEWETAEDMEGDINASFWETMECAADENDLFYDAYYCLYDAIRFMGLTAKRDAINIIAYTYLSELLKK